MAFRKKPRVVKKRLYKRKAVKSKSLAVLTRKVNKLTRASNQVEEKEIVLSNGIATYYIAQVNNTSNGYFLLDVTPVTSQSTTDITRIGSQITATKATYRFQLIAQPNMNTNVSIKFLLVKVKGLPITPSQLVTQMYNSNPFITTNLFLNAGIIDYNSDKDPDFVKNYQILKTKTVKYNMENYASGKAIHDISMSHYFKGGHNVFFDGNTNVVQSGQIVLIVLSSAGNQSGSISSLNGVAIQDSSSAYVINYNIRTMYRDA